MRNSSLFQKPSSDVPQYSRGVYLRQLSIWYVPRDKSKRRRNSLNKIFLKGYTGSGFLCTDVNECLVQNGGCSVQPMVTCINTIGSSTCGSCPPGYAGDGRTCSYVGLCQTNNGGCHPNARCQGQSHFQLRL